MRWGGDCGSAAAMREMPTAQRCFDSRFFTLTALIQVAQAAADFARHMFWRLVITRAGMTQELQTCDLLTHK